MCLNAGKARAILSGPENDLEEFVFSIPKRILARIIALLKIMANGFDFGKLLRARCLNM